MSVSPDKSSSEDSREEAKLEVSPLRLDVKTKSMVEEIEGSLDETQSVIGVKLCKYSDVRSGQELVSQRLPEEASMLSKPQINQYDFVLSRAPSQTDLMESTDEGRKGASENPIKSNAVKMANGLTYHQESKGIEIQLNNRNMFVLLTEALSHDNIVSLSCSQNVLSNLPDSLGNFTTLQRLSLDNN